MDEELKRRLVGAAVLIALAFIGVSLLPDRGQPPVVGDDDIEVVTIPVQAESIAEVTLPPTARDPEAAAIEDDSVPAETGVADLPMPAGDDDAPPAETAAARPLPSSEPAAMAEPVPKPVAKAEPAPESAPAAPKPAPQPTAPVAGTDPSGPWYVQVGGFADIDNAREVQQRLQALGFKTLLAPADTPKGTLYRVRAGPYRDRAGAQRAREQAAAQGFAAAALVAPP